MALSFIQENITRTEEFTPPTFTAGGKFTSEFTMADDLMGVVIMLEADIDSATAANPTNHGIIQLIKNLRVTVQGSNERVNARGYSLHVMSQMYLRRRGINQMFQAIGAGQKLLAAVFVPIHIKAQPQKKLQLEYSFAVKDVLDTTPANVTINSVTIKNMAIFGVTSEITILNEASLTFATSNKDLRIGADEMFAQNLAIYGDSEAAAGLYDAIDRMVIKVGSNVIIEGDADLLAAYGGLIASTSIDKNGGFLTAVFNAFDDDLLSRGLLVPLPATLTPGDLLLKLDRTTLDNIFTALLQSIPDAVATEVPVIQEVEGTVTKQPKRLN